MLISACEIHSTDMKHSGCADRHQGLTPSTAQKEIALGGVWHSLAMTNQLQSMEQDEYLGHRHNLVNCSLYHFRSTLVI